MKMLLQMLRANYFFMRIVKKRQLLECEIFRNYSGMRIFIKYFLSIKDLLLYL